jgi:hypothetical protein
MIESKTIKELMNEGATHDTEGDTKKPQEKTLHKEKKNFWKSGKGILLILSMASIWFYWYELRPANIRSYCADTYLYYKYEMPDGGVNYMNINTDKANSDFSDCLRINGL